MPAYRDDTSQSLVLDRHLQGILRYLAEVFERVRDILPWQFIAQIVMPVRNYIDGLVSGVQAHEFDFSIDSIYSVVLIFIFSANK